jgi:dolichyl-diphosphooligosaccharide--protein glycosyltransferase
MVLFPADARYFGSNAFEPWYKRTPTGITAKSTPYAPSQAWLETLDWMKNNTPEPFGSPDAYLRQYSELPAGQGFVYPESAYGVLAWWDYGYWITYIGHRMPNANPGQEQTAVSKVASFLIAQDEDSAEAIAAALDSGYVIADYQTATSKFWAVVTWAGRSPSEFFDTYYTKDGQPKTLIYPEYYRSLCARLYGFDGQAVTAQSPTVYAYQEIEQNGVVFRLITSETPFQTYEEAQAYVNSQESGKYVIASTDPLVSPVSLEPLQHYKPVYSTSDNVSVSATKQTAEIKVFERAR